MRWQEIAEEFGWQPNVEVVWELKLSNSAGWVGWELDAGTRRLVGEPAWLLGRIRALSLPGPEGKPLTDLADPVAARRLSEQVLAGLGLLGG